MTKINLANQIISKRLKESSLFAYPKPIGSMNRGIYHFYANAFIFDKLIQEGVPLRYAAASVWAINDIYEKVIYKQDFDHMHRDIFLGYAAVLFMSDSSSKRYNGPLMPSYYEDIRNKTFPKKFIDSIPNFCTKESRAVEAPVSQETQLIDQ